MLNFTVFANIGSFSISVEKLDHLKAFVPFSMLRWANANLKKDIYEMPNLKKKLILS